jgi:hypothetical protein
MKWIAAAILALAVVGLVVGWRATEHQHATCGGGIGPTLACSK